MTDKILFIGGCGHGKPTTNGVAAKNYFLLSRLKELSPHVKAIDTDGWKRNPLILLQLCLYLSIHRRHKIIISLNTPSAYKFICVANRLFPRRRLCYFVIGGVLADYMRDGQVKLQPYRCIDWFVVESQQMKKQMQALGFLNVIHLPNFKHIDYLPAKQPHQETEPTRFVFLSRIIPEKGCDYIFEALHILNSQGLAQQVSVDFFGTIDEDYRQHFTQLTAETPNAEYKGFLDLRESENYDILAAYDAMLFPTYWPGEGFPGIIVDAFIAGLPVIATDWAHNSEIIEHQQTGIIIPPHDPAELARQMQNLSNNPAEFHRMSLNCQTRARMFDVRNLLSKKFMENLLE
ncbi:MAG: glycosyltransferase [Prevotella sp.]|nr:glycosyltransferase [Prevotella sp.]